MHRKNYANNKKFKEVLKKQLLFKVKVKHVMCGQGYGYTNATIFLECPNMYQQLPKVYNKHMCLKTYQACTKQLDVNVAFTPVRCKINF